MEIIGYILAACIGISLGLIGGGGSILTVPLLVYVFHLSPFTATSYSLFIVGVTSLVGAYNNYRKGYARITLALPLGIVSPLTVFIVRHYMVPHIPEHLGMFGKMEITRSGATMLLFALLMIIASASMLKKQVSPLQSTQQKLLTSKDYFIIALFGIGIGCVTGFLGAGGGFLIIPALVLLLKLSMKEAVGTSLFIIAINSLVGFLGDIGHYHIHWGFLFTITSIAIAGVLAGGQLAKGVSSNKLKNGFGWFVLLMGSYIVVKEIFLK